MIDREYTKLALEELGREYIEEIKKILISDNKVASGALINSLRYEVVLTPSGFQLQIYSLDYMKEVDKGRRAGARMPPPNKIIPWVESKGMNFEGNLKSTAFAIAKSIGIKGTKATNILDRVKQIMIQKQKESIIIGFKKDVEREIEIIKKELEKK